MIVGQAPGKVVLWGEYAVLTGAPALVQAVDRYALCRLQPGGHGWRARTRGFSLAPGAGPATLTMEQLSDRHPPAADSPWSVLWHAARACDGELPCGGEVEFDTAALHLRDSKLGLGSSAALTVATYGALCRWLERPASLAGALRAHGRWQAAGAEPQAADITSGSGIDVAAAWHGGLLRFRRAGRGEALPAEASAWQMPQDLHMVHVWTGTPARTGDHLARLARHLEDVGDAALARLGEHSERLFAQGASMTRLEDYVAALDALDHAAALGIFSEPHQVLRQLAKDHGVVYKPCGAGGGDIGVAFSGEPAAIRNFADRAASLGFVPLPLETATHGIQITS